MLTRSKRKLKEEQEDVEVIRLKRTRNADGSVTYAIIPYNECDDDDSFDDDDEEEENEENEDDEIIDNGDDNNDDNNNYNNNNSSCSSSDNKNNKNNYNKKYRQVEEIDGFRRYELCVDLVNSNAEIKLKAMWTGYPETDNDYLDTPSVKVTNNVYRARILFLIVFLLFVVYY